MPYRFELAPSGRAGCTNKECKDAKEKIPKGSLRVGSWVDTDRMQSYFWRHWQSYGGNLIILRGCTTPRVLENIRTGWEDSCSDGKSDYTLLDGYDELPEEFQEKIRRALENGHIDDADWRGQQLTCSEDKDAGSPSKATEGPSKSEDTPTDPKNDAEETKPKNSRASRKKAPVTTEAKVEDVEEDTPASSQVDAEEAKPKKSRASKKKTPAATEADADNVEKKPTKKSPKKTIKEESNDQQKSTKKSAKPATKKVTPTTTGDSTEASAVPKSKKISRPAKSTASEENLIKSTKGVKRKAIEKEEQVEEATDQGPKRRGKSSKPRVDPKEDVPSRPKRNARRKVAEATDDSN
ncbi:zf-PARP-domain-containing protein [Penicillium odoratum]|uniref:zf-PARP-domain-containing protein n=1 Tax=Penicillium odoratum TaxID=1167516 RepID=UPI00254726DD|nr:zf-PARP-domain-containing protein [Penicillium odoratum]KAJ5760509.1 zf-PARP-domain-containing protein [Penicillium odoratum]